MQAQINELGTNLLVVSPGQLDRQHRRAGRVRLGVDAHHRRRRGARRRRGRARRAGGRRDRDHARVASTNGTTNWTTTLTGTTPSWQEVRAREVTIGPFIDAADEDARGRVVVLGPDTASELFGGPATRSARPSPSTARRSGGRRARGAPLVRGRRRTTTWRSCRSRPTRSGWSAARPRLGERDLREGDRRTPSRPRTRRPTRCCSNLHGITTATTPTSRSRPRTRSSARPPRSTRR